MLKNNTMKTNKSKILSKIKKGDKIMEKQINEISIREVKKFFPNGLDIFIGKVKIEDANPNVWYGTSILDIYIREEINHAENLWQAIMSDEDKQDDFEKNYKLPADEGIVYALIEKFNATSDELLSVKSIERYINEFCPNAKVTILTNKENLQDTAQMYKTILTGLPSIDEFRKNTLNNELDFETSVNKINCYEYYLPSLFTKHFLHKKYDILPISGIYLPKGKNIMNLIMAIYDMRHNPEFLEEYEKQCQEYEREFKKNFDEIITRLIEKCTYQKFDYENDGIVYRLISIKQLCEALKKLGIDLAEVKVRTNPYLLHEIEMLYKDKNIDIEKELDNVKGNTIYEKLINTNPCMSN